MRIAYDHQIFGWQEYGGVSRYFFELADNIASMDAAEVAIISPLYVNAYLSAATSKLQVTGRKIPTMRCTGRIIHAIDQLLTPSLMKSFKPDLVHKTYYSTKSRVPVGSKGVLTVFDMIHERFPKCFSAGDTTAKEKAVAVADADHIICISEQTRNDLVQLLHVKPEKTSVVHLGFSLTKVPENKPIENKRPYMLYVGGRGSYKNFEALLRAYAGKPGLQCEYDLVAFGGGALTATERSLLEKLGIQSSRVQQLGGSDSVLAGLYRQAALFVYPSRYEGFGMPPLEAMSFSCPVVCSNTSSIPEVVGDAAELFDPDSIASIGQAIERVLGDQALQRALVERGQERIKLYSWKRCAEQTLDVYKEILK